MKPELKTRPTHECRYDERLKTKAEESTRLAYTELLGELEDLKINRREVTRSLRAAVFFFSRAESSLKVEFD